MTVLVDHRGEDLSRWRVVESSCEPKPGRPNEDVLLLGAHHVGIFDGCTSKRAHWPLRESPGALAARLVAASFTDVDRDATMAQAVAHAGDALVRGLARLGVDLHDGLEPPSTTMLVVSLSREELWSVGDGHALVDTAHTSFEGPPSDAVVASVRSLHQALSVAAGGQVDEVLARDAAHDLVLPLLEAQWHVRNRDDSPWGYGSIDGSAVPERFLRVVPLDGAREVVLASDGYLRAAPTLGDAERDLHELATADPLQSPSTRARVGASPYFDDRSYLRLRRVSNPAQR